MQFQLRDYTVENGRLDQFVREWHELVLPLRKSLGFSVLGPWVERETNRFVWLVGYDGDIREADARYYASDVRKAMDPDPGRFVLERREVWLEPLSK